MISSTPLSIIKDMAELVLTSPGDRVSVLGCLFQAIEDGMIVEGKTESERVELWLEVLVMLRTFMMAGEVTQTIIDGQWLRPVGCKNAHFYPEQRRDYNQTLCEKILHLSFDHYEFYSSGRCKKCQKRLNKMMEQT